MYSCKIKHTNFVQFRYIYILVIEFAFSFCADIRRRLLELSNKGPQPKYDNTSELLAELRAQEQRNQKALDDLKRQLFDINHQRVNFM